MLSGPGGPETTSLSILPGRKNAVNKKKWDPRSNLCLQGRTETQGGLRPSRSGSRSLSHTILLRTEVCVSVCDTAMRHLCDSTSMDINLKKRPNPEKTRQSSVTASLAPSLLFQWAIWFHHGSDSVTELNSHYNVTSSLWLLYADNIFPRSSTGIFFFIMLLETLTWL